MKKPSDLSNTSQQRRLNKVMAGLLGPVLAKQGLVLARILAEWPKLAGDMAAWATPQETRFPAGGSREGVLVVRVASGFAPRLQMQAATLITQLNTRLGYAAIKRISILQGDADGIAAITLPAGAYPDPDLAPKAPPPPLPSASMPKDEYWQAVTSPQLREALEKLGIYVTGTKPRPPCD